MKFKEFVATGANDEEVDHWICENATQNDRKAMIKWNNEMRCVRLCDLSEQVQEYFESYIPKFCHPPSKNVAIFGRFTYKSTVLSKTVTSPFAVFAKVRKGRCTYMQFMEDTFATGDSFRKAGHWLFHSDPEGGEVTI